MRLPIRAFAGSVRIPVHHFTASPSGAVTHTLGYINEGESAIVTDILMYAQIRGNSQVRCSTPEFLLTTASQDTGPMTPVNDLQSLRVPSSSSPEACPVRKGVRIP